MVEQVVLGHARVVFADHDIELAGCLRLVAGNNKTLVSYTARILCLVLARTRRERVSFVKTLDFYSELSAFCFVLLLASHIFQRKRLEIAHIDVVAWAWRSIVDLNDFASLRSLE